MSEPAGLYGEIGAQHRLAQELVNRLPEDGSRIELECALLSTVMTAYLDVVDKDGSTQSIRPGDLYDSELIQDLRRAMYRDGQGTWFSMKFSVTAGGEMDADFNYDDEPDFGLGGVDPVAYVNDAKEFPRDLEHQPDWLKARLAEGQARINASNR